LTAALVQGQALGRLAAIDVGSNTIRLVVVEVSANRTYRVLDDEKVVARLARGLSNGDAMSPQLMTEAAETIARFKAIAEGYGVTELRAAATWAVRRAANGPQFVAMVQERAGVEVAVLSAEEEARLVFLGVRHTFDLSSMTVAVVDVGGGSTEVVLGTGEVIDRIYPLPLGSVGLTERFGQPGSATRYREMRRSILRALERRVGRPPVVPHLLIGTGGTFTTLAAISMHRGSRQRDSTVLPFNVRGYELQRSEVKHVLERLRKMSLRERLKVPGLSPDRADIIVSGLAIVECVLKHFDINRVRVADQGIRAGLVQAMIDTHWPRSGPGLAATVDRMRSVRQFAAACGWEGSHAEHVAGLAGQLFDQLAADGAMGDDGWRSAAHRELLVAAALLHDVGYVINYSKHHKHSYHLILHSGLPGFTQRELELIACIARYHRGAHPKPKHTMFARLSPPERRVVRRLAGMLRLAVGLDRSHAQEIQRIRLRCTRRTAFIDVEADGNPSVDLWAGARHCGLFEESCGRRVRFRWAPPEGAPSGAEEELIHARS
jgi:exopolyphosphatase/guanosine-5'-triphosphate,3'-diphosphate pyrophosphatase